MSDDESRHEHLPTEGGEIFAENGSETVENGANANSLASQKFGRIPAPITELALNIVHLGTDLYDDARSQVEDFSFVKNFLIPYS